MKPEEKARPEPLPDADSLVSATECTGLEPAFPRAEAQAAVGRQRPRRPRRTKRPVQ